MSVEEPECAAILETRLLHKMHRAATSLLAQAAQSPTAPPIALKELRDFLVAALRHHHESEDDVLWPQLTAAGPTAPDDLAGLHAEHDALDTALHALAGAPVEDGHDRPMLIAAAVAVRDLVHTHLGHEEIVLFPALASQMSDEAWSQFSRAVIASAPPVGAHLNIGFFEQVGTSAELAVVAANLPHAALNLLPAMRQQAEATLSSLQAATDHTRSVSA
ncbi:hemerythrin domain-containing protein [Streptomyces sp. SID13666]|uniref:hemerythrin domain-containing protein n=1 Tax=unclassified Streptomyces TaxID=2593676 RepID=UPI0013C09254|nr:MULTISPECIES: hemerythrin domain-containing protein [unclassified Streptomyces]NEA56533.1 hemerythrin domain-containing protein [Streptomyces sp. SID13666]NEA72327.1 hemerythrin domain-containing protein [Streptomyces sp. SID13588]